MRQPHEVENPSPKNSKIHPRIFSNQPEKLKAKKKKTTSTIIPNPSIMPNLDNITKITFRMKRETGAGYSNCLLQQVS